MIRKSIETCLLLLFIGLFNTSLNGQNKETDLIEQLLSKNKNLFSKVLESPGKYKVQIIYTRIDRDENNSPSFTTHKYRIDADDYYYPASTVKFPASLLALEKINELGINGLTKHTPLQIDSAFSGQTKVLYDSSAENYKPTIAHYINKVFLVSDNDAFNRLYEFVGQKEFNERLWIKRYRDVKIIHRLAVSLSPEQNRHTNPFTFYDGEKVIYHQPAEFNPLQYKNYCNDLLQGIGYYYGDSLLYEPMNFTYKNYLSLEDQHNILKAVMMPDAVPVEQKFNLTDDDYEFLYKSMSMFPKESRYPKYDGEKHSDFSMKMFSFWKQEDEDMSGIRIFNKVGGAYGYLIDNSYFVDFNNKIEFFLSAVIYVNEDQIFNDDKYEYDEIGYPYMSNLGRVFYEYEKSRAKKNLPVLDKYLIDYTK